MIKIPKPLYDAKPVIFLLVALSLMLLTQNAIVMFLGICLMGYSAWVFYKRLT